MIYFIVEHIYYKQKFFVRAKSEVDAKIKLIRELEREGRMNAKLTEFEVYMLPAFSYCADVVWL